MDAFTSHTGVGVPLRRSNVDTDQIIPAVYLKRVTRDGFEDGLFSAWRNDPEFVLNNPVYAAGSVLVAGPDFGTGSSREHAVWALQNRPVPTTLIGLEDTFAESGSYAKTLEKFGLSADAIAEKAAALVARKKAS